MSTTALTNPPHDNSRETRSSLHARKQAAAARPGKHTALPALTGSALLRLTADTCACVVGTKGSGPRRRRMAALAAACAIDVGDSGSTCDARGHTHDQ